VIATASGAGAPSASAPVAAAGGGAPREDADGRGSMVPTQAQPTELPFAMPALPDADPGTGLQRFGVELTATSTSVFFVPAGKNVDVLLHGGVFVQTYRRLPRVGEVVILVMRFAGGERFETAAAVNWVREAALNEPDPGFGARLYALTDAQAGVVRAYLNTRPPARLRT
jgi:Tfp pilus assembly protein PilZ